MLLADFMNYVIEQLKPVADGFQGFAPAFHLTKLAMLEVRPAGESSYA
ncbi:hypothetical protein POL68_27955 [Stigmatella sp. ncwal1]|uniref:Transposase n=1 Tax=Stigmatella ashevillensis TaxID=2995309 RepID=A0ABT5DGX4_9BACT|nr:hypothetical protein [Stigmatella ashevillena]MDC0712329.1 hypothetical protein [Stigmatella ashevillena]